MRVLWILPYLPWPTSSGGKTRQYHLLRSLAARGVRITLLVQSKTPPDEATRQALEPYLERLIVLPRRSLRSPLGLLLALLGPYPLLTAINGLAPKLTQTFNTLLQEPWDVVQIEHSYSAQPYLATLKRYPKGFLLCEHNLESSLGGATYGRFPKWAAPFVWFDQWRARRWERTLFAEARQLVAVTENDAKAMAQLTHTQVSVVVNGVDCAHFAKVQADPAAQRILFVGNYEYPPNVDAVIWALDEILPLVWRTHPKARFAVAGYALPGDWPERWSDSRIEWHGFVEDLSVLQNQCSLFFAPLRQGGGSKLKVLETLAAGLPLVTTAQGASGLALKDGQHARICETAQNLAQALGQVLDDDSAAQQLAQAGRDYVQRHHDWSAAADQLQQVYQKMQAGA